MADLDNMKFPLNYKNSNSDYSGDGIYDSTDVV